MKQIRPEGNLVVVAGEELLSIIETRSPGQIAADLQVFPQAMAHHVRSEDAFGWPGVMRATRGVDVVIAGPPAGLRGINPAFELERPGRVLSINLEGRGFCHVLRSAGVFDRVFATRQFLRLAVSSI